MQTSLREKRPFASLSKTHLLEEKKFVVQQLQENKQDPYYKSQLSHINKELKRRK